MFPGVNPKDMAKAMKQMGIKQEELPVQQVIFKLDNCDIIIDNPSVTEVQMGAEKNFQVTGKTRIEEREEIIEITEEDIQTVADQTGLTIEKAEEALIEADGDIAQAIINAMEN